MNIISSLIDINSNLEITGSLKFSDYKNIAKAFVNLDSRSQVECVSFLIPYSFSTPANHIYFTIYHIIFQEYIKEMKKSNPQKLYKVILRSLFFLYPNISLNMLKYLEYLECIDWNTVYNNFTLLSYIMYNSFLKNEDDYLDFNLYNIITYIYIDHDVINKEDCLNVKLCMEYYNSYYVHGNKLELHNTFPTLQDINRLETIIGSATVLGMLGVMMKELDLFCKKNNCTIKEIMNYKDMYNRPIYINITDYELFDHLCTENIIDKKSLHHTVIYTHELNIPIYRIIMDNIKEQYIPIFLDKYVGLLDTPTSNIEKSHNEGIKEIIKDNIIINQNVVKYLF